MPIRYTDPLDDVPPGVDFLNAEAVNAWVAACEIDKPWRDPMRKRFADLISALPHGARVLEPGSGPGYLAETVLERAPHLDSYTLLDFSEHMLELSRRRLERFESAHFIKADFKTAHWSRRLNPPYTAILAMQAVHEIRHKRHVAGFNRQLVDLLEPGGLLAVCDGTPRAPTVLWQTSLFMNAEEHLAAFASAGFNEIEIQVEIGSLILITGRVSRGINLITRFKQSD